jgi:hypothetical protein
VDATVDALDRAVFDIASFLSTAVTQAHIAHPAVRFVIDADDGLRVCGDRDRLYQVVANRSRRERGQNSVGHSKSCLALKSGASNHLIGSGPAELLPFRDLNPT